MVEKCDVGIFLPHKGCTRQGRSRVIPELRRRGEFQGQVQLRDGSVLRTINDLRMKES